MIKKITRLFWTIRYLKPSQLYYRLYYKVNSGSYKSYPYSKSPTTLELLNPIASFHCYDAHKKSFTFLNKEKAFNDKVDWNFGGFGKLWTYNLNYFDFLNQNHISKEEGLDLIDNYIENIKNIKDGFEPYPVSLRLINFIKFFSKHKPEKESYIDFIFSNAKLLTKSVEYHLLGNHLLENAFALLFAAVFFNDNSFYTLAKKILQKQLKEQILDDGAHFELSPMYHSIILLRVLDSINILDNTIEARKELLPLLIETASKMLSWLNEITFRNGDIPYFNDAASGIAPNSTELIAYANRLNISVPNCSLEASGYHKLKTDNIESIIKSGQIGPDYIPGHAHADTFSFVMHIDQQPFIIDTGVSTYEQGELRATERATSAHNTVTIDQQNSSDTWSAFRVGKRAKTTIYKKDATSLIASHSGYAVIHKREFEVQENSLSIDDSVSTSQHSKSAHLHFHPSVKVYKTNNKLSTSLAEIEFTNADSINISDCNIAREFNKLIPTKKAVVTFQNNLKTKISVNVKNN